MVPKRGSWGATEEFQGRCRVCPGLGSNVGGVSLPSDPFPRDGDPVSMREEAFMRKVVECSIHHLVWICSRCSKTDGWMECYCFLQLRTVIVWIDRYTVEMRKLVSIHGIGLSELIIHTAELSRCPKPSLLVPCCMDVDVHRHRGAPAASFHAGCVHLLQP